MAFWDGAPAPPDKETDLRPMLAALLAGAGFFALIARRPRSTESRQRGDQEAGPAQGRAAPARQEKPIRPLPPPPDAADCADEREHRRKERRYWKWSILIGAGSAVGAIAAAWFAASALRASWRAVDVARDSYLATTRAWFDVDVDPSDLSLAWKQGVGATLYYKVKGVNNGSSPATNVSLSANLEVDRGIVEFPRKNIIEESCTKWTPLSGGDIVFMKEPIEHNGPAFAAWYEIIPPTPEGAERPNQIGDSVPFYLVACAMYKIVGDEKWHHTARVFRVLRIDDSDDARVSHLLKIGEDLVDDRLTVVREGGAYAD